MARTIYSAPLGEISSFVPVPDTTVYTAPAGGTTVLRDIDVYAAAGNTVSVYVVRSGTPATLVNHASSVPNGDTLGWRGRVVLGPGDEIHVSATGPGGAAQMTASGYFLAAA